MNTPEEELYLLALGRYVQAVRREQKRQPKFIYLGQSEKRMFEGIYRRNHQLTEDELRTRYPKRLFQDIPVVYVESESHLEIA